MLFISPPRLLLQGFRRSATTRAIIHSIHSQVPRTLSSLKRRPELILSLDSHLDVSLGGDVDIYPDELRVIASRTSVHSALCEMYGGIASLREAPAKTKDRAAVVVAIPERMLARHASDIELGLPKNLRLLNPGESISSVMEFLEKTIGIKVYPSPPGSLMNLVKRFIGKSWALDVDVDYMQEMQDECYTRIRNIEHGVLQSERTVLRSIEASRPDVITISEARVKALRDSTSRISGLIAALERMGYETEERGVYSSDREVLKGIAVCKEFYRAVSRPLMIKNMDSMMAGNLKGFEEEEAEAARVFFATYNHRRPP